ncbi:MAG TPA: SH3 domain-containing protein [Aggregatilineales bacterium]|nr:SH3 domain-containing protein [Aggregatilineales bacterium]
MNRRLITSATLAVILVMGFAVFQSPTQAKPIAVQVDPCAPVTVGIKGIVVATLRLRAKPSTSEAQIALLQPNDVVTAIGRNTSGTWVEITTSGNQTGWVGSPYVVLIKGKLTDLPIVDSSGNAAETGPTVSGIQGIIVSKLTLRAKPSTGEAALGILNPDDLVTVTGRNSTGTWLQVTTSGGLSGWVASPYVALVKTTLDNVPVVDTSSNAAATEAAAPESTPESTEASTAIATECPPATEAASGVALKGIVVSTSLKVHTKPAIAAPEATAPLAADDPVTVTGRNSSGTWLQITTASGVTGWVASPYVVLSNGHLEDLPIVQ